MLRKIKLYGRLAKFIGARVLEADVASAAEAVRFLVTNWPAVEAHMADQHYRVSIDTYDLAAEELHDPAGSATISIRPVIAGAGAVGRILLGVALVALSFAFPAATIFGTKIAGTLLGVGAAMALGGVAQLLSPVPKINTLSEQDPKRSYSFSGIQNTSRPGTPIPIVYGETLVGSIVISASLDTVQVAV